MCSVRPGIDKFPNYHLSVFERQCLVVSHAPSWSSLFTHFPVESLSKRKHTISKIIYKTLNFLHPASSIAIASANTASNFVWEFKLAYNATSDRKTSSSDGRRRGKKGDPFTSVKDLSLKCGGNTSHRLSVSN